MKNVVPVIEKDNQIINRIKTVHLKAIKKNARIWNCKKTCYS